MSIRLYMSRMLGIIDRMGGDAQSAHFEECWRIHDACLLRKVHDVLAADTHQTLQDENRLFRELLWINHGCSFSSLYGDDGEMQCSRCGLDFKRLAPEDIARRWRTTNEQALIDWSAARAAEKRDVDNAAGKKS